MAEHIQDVTEIDSLLVEGLTAEEKVVVDTALIQTYKKFGWSLHGKNLPDKDKTYPLLIDVYKTLKALKEKRLCDRLEKFVTGSLSEVFSSHTTINLKNRLVIFDIKDLSESLRQIMMLVVANLSILI